MKEGDASPPHRKRAETFADAIENEIRDLGLGVNAQIGTLDELEKRYSLSRPVLREGLAIATQRGLVNVRRGKGGGVFVAQESREVAITAIIGYLDFALPEIGTIITLRNELEARVISLADQRITEDGLDELSNLTNRFADDLDADRLNLANSMLSCMARHSANPLFEIYVIALSKLTVERFARNADRQRALLNAASQIAALRKDQADAIIGKMPRLAYDASCRISKLMADMARLGTYHSDGSIVSNFDNSHSDLRPRVSAPDRVARRLRSRILQERLTEGFHLGSEEDLQLQYGVSRGTLREAVRQLEHMSFVKMVRGNGGGLRVAIPDITRVSRAVIQHLRGGSLTPRSVLEVGETLALHIVGHITEISFAERERLSQLCKRFAPHSASTVYLMLAKMAAEKGAETLCLLQSDLSQLLEPPSTNRLNNRNYAAECTNLSEAIRRGALPQARRAALRLLRSVTTNMSAIK